MTPEKIAALKAALPTMGMQEKLHVLELLDEWEKRQHAQRARGSLLTFVKKINPAYKIGPHHRILATKLEAAAKGQIDRLATAIAPRFGKSLLLSLYFPAWFMGNFPEQKLLITSHTADLAVDFGRKVRNLIDSKDYKEIFPGVSLSVDSKSAGRWTTSEGGEFYACGVGGALAGRGADLCVAPDTLVVTRNGMKRAADVNVGDYLLGSDGFGKVLHKISSCHEATVDVDGLKMSEGHPVWTANRGWVSAQKISPEDLLQSTPSWVKMASSIYLRASHAAQTYYSRAILRTDVQHLGDDAATLHKPQRSQLQQLRRARNFCRSSVEQICLFFRRYGAPTFRKAYSGPQGHEWQLHKRQLPLGDSRDSAKQQKKLGYFDGVWKNNVDETVEPRAWGQVRSFAAPDSRDGVEYRRSSDDAEGESQSAASCLLHIIRKTACSVLGVARRYGEGYRIRQASNPSLLVRAQQIGQRVFLGLRKPRRICHSFHEPREFVNFHVEGHNTFVANGFLTHNCIIDDPFSEQDILNGNYEVFDKVYEWYAYGARTRLMPGGRVVVLHTRWAKNDLIGRIVEEAAKNPESDQWEYIEFPAIMNEGTDNEKSLWPEQWSLEALKKTRATMPLFQWQAQYQQSPTSQQGALIKAEWWQTWKNEDPPYCDYIIMALDAAQETNKRSDFTAITTWGIFYIDDESDGTKKAAIILLNAINKRLEFPQLKDLALKEYKEWKPDCFIIEKKSNGAALAQELRRMGIPLQDYTPTRGTATNVNTKFARVSAVADIVRSGLVWAPQTRWAEEVIEQCNDFPAGKNDDLVDSTVMSLMRFRSGGFIQLPSDDYEDTPRFNPRRKAAYYSVV